MSKKIDVSKAKEWSEEEAAFNVRYLRDRSRFAEADEVVAARDGVEPPTPPDGDDEEPSAPIKPSEAEDSPDQKTDTTKLNAKQVIEWVDNDGVRAGEALQAELESEKPRPKLVEQLEKLAG